MKSQLTVKSVHPQCNAVLQVGEHEIHAVMGSHETRQSARRIPQDPGLTRCGVPDEGYIASPVPLEQAPAAGLHNLEALARIEINTKRGRYAIQSRLKIAPKDGACTVIEQERLAGTLPQARHEMQQSPESRSARAHPDPTAAIRSASDRALAVACRSCGFQIRTKYRYMGPFPILQTTMMGV